MPSSETPRDPTIQSVDRAVSVLQALSRHRDGAGVTDIATEIGVHKSTTFRLLATLEARGLVTRDGDRSRYHLGQTIHQLAAGAAGSYDLVTTARPLVQELATALGETVNVVISDGHQVTTVDQVTGSAIVSSSDWVGRRAPLHATAAGKVFLAAMTPADLDAVLARGLDGFTEATVTSTRELRDQLVEVRSRGWATTYEEHEIGLVVVAAAVRDAQERVIGALTVGGPSYRVNAETLPGLTERVLGVAARVSWRLGSLKH